MRLLTILAITFSINAKLLDKISAVINSEVITLSTIQRIQASLDARRNVSPFIYGKSSYSDDQIADLVIRKFIVREKLKELGYVIGDAHVESEIKEREQKLGLTRRELLAFLKGNKTNYDEFFEITREAIEFNIFNSRIIIPLVSVGEQEIKNEFFKENVNNKTISFKYTLVDFSIDPDKLSSKEWPEFKKTMIDFQKGSQLPRKYNSIESSTLGDISEEGLTKELQALIKKSGEGEFTDPLLMFGKVHIFFIKNRDVVESDLFLSSKDRLRAKLYEKKAVEVTNLWFEREMSNNYVKKY